jgi:hypothetical protein
MNPPDMNPEERIGEPYPGDPYGWLCGVMLRCIGDAEYGAVLVDGGAEYVMLPRLPNEPPLPARASANPGASARARAVTPASRTR